LVAILGSFEKGIVCGYRCRTKKSVKRWGLFSGNFLWSFNNLDFTCYFSYYSLLSLTQLFNFNVAHNLEYCYGAHEYPTSGVYEVEPRNCPGFIFRRSVLLGTTSMSRSDFRSYMEKLSRKYHGDTYHLIAKNCNHFTEEVCLQLTGKPIPGWINRLARVGKRYNKPFSVLSYKQIVS